jgi:hypothetical protein
VEENVRYIKLAFPVTAEMTWNCNAENTLEENICRYHFINQARIIGGHTFDSVLQVNIDDQIDLFNRHYSIERYAKNTGLVFKQFIDIESQPNSAWFGTPYEADSLHFIILI